MRCREAVVERLQGSARRRCEVSGRRLPRRRPWPRTPPATRRTGPGPSPRAAGRPRRTRRAAVPGRTTSAACPGRPRSPPVPRTCSGAPRAPSSPAPGSPRSGPRSLRTHRPWPPGTPRARPGLRPAPCRTATRRCRPCRGSRCAACAVRARRPGPPAGQPPSSAGRSRPGSSACATPRRAACSARAARGKRAAASLRRPAVHHRAHPHSPRAAPEIDPRTAPRPGARNHAGGRVNSLALFFTVFVACAVEAVEALTIVLAAGLTREWRSTFQGMAAALGVLAVTVAVLGPALTLVPLTWLRLVVGGLLAVFGLQWLRKAILRASGYKGLHDEGAIYTRQVAAARTATGGSRRGVRDWYAFTLSFKGVLLEGLEVVFIAITFGASQQNVGLAAAAAVAAVVVVAAVGIAVRAPLSRVPENTMKFSVGVMLTSFGVFWGAEGAGVSWPGNDAALLAVIPATALVALGYVALLRRARATAVPSESSAAAPERSTS